MAPEEERRGGPEPLFPRFGHRGRHDLLVHPDAADKSQQDPIVITPGDTKSNSVPIPARGSTVADDTSYGDARKLH